MADVMFILRQLVEKNLEGYDDTATGFIDLEKAYDTYAKDHDGWSRAGAELETAGYTPGG